MSIKIEDAKFQNLINYINSWLFEKYYHSKNSIRKIVCNNCKCCHTIFLDNIDGLQSLYNSKLILKLSKDLNIVILKLSFYCDVCGNNIEYIENIDIHDLNLKENIND